MKSDFNWILIGNEGFVDGLWIADKWLGISDESVSLLGINAGIVWEGGRNDEPNVEDFW